jgi:pimeloyl-ACP methyl ester carboxylesterase
VSEGIAVIAYDRIGSGEPLVLIHGLGSNRRIWLPVVGRLAVERDVIAVDMPGFGESPPLPEPAEPRPQALARAIAGLLDDLGVETAHVAGNSLGGWVAVELARMGRARSVTLLSPAGLWRDEAPSYARLVLLATRALARGLDRWLPVLLRRPLGRTLLLGHLVGRPWRVPGDEALAAARALAGCPGFDRTLEALHHRRMDGAREVAVPMTVVFGARDWLLLPGQARFAGLLPDHVPIRLLPGCGHVPTYDDPCQVTTLILESSKPAGG